MESSLKRKTKYYGVYDRKESNTFRPTIEKRIHKDRDAAKTIETKSDSCCIITIGGGRWKIAN